jgi:hypothetical protein
MKRLRFLSGEGNGTATVPDGQVISITMVPGLAAPALGSWVRIAQSKSIFVPPGITLDLQADDLGNCCGDDTCDRWPGDVQIVIEFGQAADPASPPASDPPASWLVIYNG